MSPREALSDLLLALALVALLVAVFACLACSFGAGGPSLMTPMPCNLTEDEWEEVRYLADVKFDLERIDHVVITFDDGGDTCEAYPR